MMCLEILAIVHLCVFLQYSVLALNPLNVVILSWKRIVVYSISSFPFKSHTRTTHVIINAVGFIIED